MSGEAMRVAKKENNINSDVRTNRTGIPTKLKERLEQSSGIALDDVRVHYNSGLPGKLDALAYTYENRVEIAPGQEHCLPHELGHVVQQKLGIVRANAMHPSGVAMNTEEGLEHQADEIGAGKKIYTTTAPSSGKIVQRKLFIRKSREVVTKSDEEMTKKVKVNKKNPLPKQSKIKKPQWLEEDSGYVEITEVSLPTIIQICISWLKERHANANLMLNKVSEKITSMISKMVQSAKWSNVCKREIPNQKKVPRLDEGTNMEVSYYFESLVDFFEYIYLCCIPEKERGNLWTKINVVNTGAGDAIVMALPEGYLIIDLGTNVNILLNYLGLRKNKVGDQRSGDRGIPIDGNKTCIIITHNHSDHTAAKSGPAGANANFLKQAIIGFRNFCEEQKNVSDKYSKFLELLENSQFEVAVFNSNEEIENLNDDSLVLYRRVNNDEAIVLSGDQGPQRLGTVLSELIDRDSENPVKQVFIKVPHHGSCENNTPSIINLISRLGKKADYVISSHNLYEHPTAGMYVTDFSLMKQGTVLIHSAELPEEDIAIENPDEKMESRVFYTANENSDYQVIAPASIAYKSNGREHVTYSKRYTATSDSAQSSDEEMLAVEYMLNGIVGLNDSQGNIPKLDKAVSMNIVRNSIAGDTNPNPNPIQYFQHKEIFTLIFYNSNAQSQIWILDNIPDPIGVNIFLDNLDIDKMNIEPSDGWAEFFGKAREPINWGQNFYYLMVRSCYGEPDMLSESLDSLLDSSNIKLIYRFLKAVLRYYPEPMDYIRQVFDVYDTECFDGKLNYALLDLHIDFKNKSVKSDRNEDDSAADILEILQNVPEEMHSKLAEYYLTCGRLSSEVFLDVFEQITESEEILLDMDISSYWKMLQLHPEHLDDIGDTILEIGSEIIDNILENEAVDDEEKERVVRLGYKLKNFTTIEANMREIKYQIDSIDEMNTFLCNCEINFEDFIQNISKEALIADINNQKIFFRFAFMSINENESFINALLKTCETYGIEYMGEYLKTMTGLLMGFLQETPIEKVQAKLKVNPVEVICENTPQGSVQNDIDRVNIVREKYAKFLYGLLQQEDLPVEIACQCYDNLTKIYPDSSEELIMNNPGLMRKLLNAPNGQGIPIILNWTQDSEMKSDYYSLLTTYNPESASYVFALHLEYYAEDAVSIYGKMDESISERLLKKASTEDILNLYQKLEKKYSTGQADIWNTIISILYRS